jgi:hypothetical protein
MNGKLAGGEGDLHQRHGDGEVAPITVIRPVRPGALPDPRRMGAVVV